jgi:hypothetical protein
MNNHEEIFSFIYKNKLWGENESKSGYASSKAFNKNFYTPFIKYFILSNNIKSIVDLGCGDFNSSFFIYNDIKNIFYEGYDCCKEIIEENIKKYLNFNFKHLDLLKNKEKIKDAELYILKDVLQHWANDDIKKFLDYIYEFKNFKYLLITNTCGDDINFRKKIKTGEFRHLCLNDEIFKKFNPILIKKWGGDYEHHKMQTFLILK